MQMGIVTETCTAAGAHSCQHLNHVGGINKPL